MNATLRVLRQDSDLNYDVELYIMRSGLNNNRWDYRNIEQNYKTFLGTPILCAYIGTQIADAHNMEEVYWKGELIYDFTGPTSERIVGAISDNPSDIRIETIEGQQWIIANGKLWRFYNRQLCDHLAEQIGRAHV